MHNPDLIQLNIEVAASEASEEEIDRMTRQLLSELRELHVESVELTKNGPVPKGAKGEPVTLGSIAIEVLPAVLPSVIGLVQVWISRRKGRTVKFRGKGFEFEGSSEELQKLLAKLESRKR